MTGWIFKNKRWVLLSWLGLTIMVVIAFVNFVAAEGEIGESNPEDILWEWAGEQGKYGFGLNMTATGDLNQNGEEEEYQLEAGCLKVQEAGKLLWKSPEDYYVIQFQLGDVTGDGRDNLILNLWKRGSFDRSIPFWHRDDENSFQREVDQKSVKNHLFVQELRGEHMMDTWCSSQLARPIVSFELVDSDEAPGGKQDLLVSEGRYEKINTYSYVIDERSLEGEKEYVESRIMTWNQWGFYEK